MHFTVQTQAGTYYFHNDHLGTPQVLTDDTQAVVWKGEYDPFGEVTETVSTVEQNLLFPGQYYDQETGLHYNYFRTCDPSTGRYVESDPLGLAAGLSTFGYVEANPLAFIDPLGLEIVGTWKKYPEWSDLNAEITNFSVWVGVGDLELASVSFEASANLYFAIVCEDTCTGENWELDSGERKLSTSGTLPVPAPPPGVSCIGKPNSLQAIICNVVNGGKYSAHAKQSAAKADEFIVNYFDKAIAAIEAATDPTAWCKTLPRK